MKKLLLILISCLLLVGCGKEEPKQPSNETNKTTEKETVKEKEYDMNITISGEEQDKEASKTKTELLGTLRKKGEEIYKAKQYTKYNKRNGAYFISLAELEKDFKYDISSYKGSDGTECDKENSGLFFDVDSVMDTNRDKETPPVIPMLIACTQAELPENNKKALDN